MAALFAAATTATATLTGFAAGVAGGALPDVGLTTTCVGLGSALALDLLAARSGRPRPWTVGRQVPVAWSRWFDPRIVAVLYGARLGVAPLTILGTWVWWAVLALGATRGAGESAMIGAAFGVTRAATTLGLGALGGDAGERHAGLFGALRTRPRAREATLGLPTIALAVILLATACTGGASADDTALTDETGTGVTAAGTGDTEATSPGGMLAADPTTEDPDVTTPDPAPATTGPEPQTSEQQTSEQQTSELETEVAEVAEVEPSADPDLDPVSFPDSLAADLVTQVDGYDRIDDPNADTYLDLEAAVARQPDPADERALLLTRGFEGGWTRAFRSDADDVIVTTVYEFADDVQADFYLQDGLIVVAGYGGELFDIPELEGVHGFRQEAGTADAPTVTWGLTFTDGNRWHLVFVNGAPDSASVDTAIAVATEQTARTTAD